MRSTREPGQGDIALTGYSNAFITNSLTRANGLRWTAVFKFNSSFLCELCSFHFCTVWFGFRFGPLPNRLGCGQFDLEPIQSRFESRSPPDPEIQSSSLFLLLLLRRRLLHSDPDQPLLFLSCLLLHFLYLPLRPPRRFVYFFASSSLH